MKHLFFTLVAATLLAPAAANAAGNFGDAIGNLGNAGRKAGTQEADVANVAGALINTALSFVGIIFMALVVYAGYLWMTARGEEEQVGKARKILTSTMIGLVITLGAYAITAVITARFGSL